MYFHCNIECGKIVFIVLLMVVKVQFFLMFQVILEGFSPSVEQSFCFFDFPVNLVWWDASVCGGITEVVPDDKLNVDVSFDD